MSRLDPLTPDLSAITGNVPKPGDALSRQQKQLQLQDVLSQIRDRDTNVALREQEIQLRQQEAQANRAQKNRELDDDNMADAIVASALAEADPKSPVQERVTETINRLRARGLNKQADAYSTSSGALMGHIKALNDQDVEKTKREQEQAVKEFEGLSTGALSHVGPDVPDTDAWNYYTMLDDYIKKHHSLGATIDQIGSPADAKRALNNFVTGSKAAAAQAKLNLDVIKERNAQKQGEKLGPVYEDTVAGLTKQKMLRTDGTSYDIEIGPIKDNPSEWELKTDLIPPGKTVPEPILVNKITGKSKPVEGGFTVKQPREPNPTKFEQDVDEWMIRNPGKTKDEAKLAISNRNEAARLQEWEKDQTALGNARSLAETRAARLKAQNEKASGKLSQATAKHLLDSIDDLAQWTLAQTRKESDPMSTSTERNFKEYSGLTFPQVRERVAGEFLGPYGLSYSELITAIGGHPAETYPPRPDRVTASDIQAQDQALRPGPPGLTPPVRPAAPVAAPAPAPAAPPIAAAPPAAPAAALPKGVQPGERFATNPTTGAVLVLRNGQWVKP